MAAAPADLIVPNSPADTPSSVHFAPRSAGSDADYLCATAWDGSVSVWEVSASGSAVPRAHSSHAAPALCSAWSADGTSVISGGCDHTVRLWSVASNQTLLIGTHNAPVRQVFDLSATGSHLPSVVSASWDKTIRYWDVRSASSSGVEGAAAAAPAATVNVSERVYAMDVKGVVMAVACAERNIHIFDLRQ